MMKLTQKVLIDDKYFLHVTLNTVFFFFFI